MARYIDADKIDFSPLKDDFDRARAKVIIMGQLTADVVEVVRCKDCKYYEPLNANVHCKGYCNYVEDLSDIVRPSDYCSYGEMKGGKR